MVPARSSPKSARDILVLGAGMVGVCTAWHLLQRGHRVTLVDRNAPGRETSFGNAGIIQREAVRPYRFPRDLATLTRVLPNRQVDIRYQPYGMVRAALPLFQYWRNSAPQRYASRGRFCDGIRQSPARARRGGASARCGDDRG